MTGIEVNWFVVGLRMLDGFLYGSGFVLALIVWYVFIDKLGGKKKEQS